MDKKSITARLNKLNKDDKLYKNLCKYITTKKGIKLVSMLHRMPIRTLCSRYDAPKKLLKHGSNTIIMNLINASIRETNVRIEEVPKITREAPVIIKHKTHLTREELRKMVAQNKPKRLGFAALMHALEEHKMDKFKVKNPGPTERELKEDLFPEELSLTYDTQLWIHREYVRNFLCRTYGNKDIRERYFRLFGVYTNKTNNKLYEKEGDPLVMGYPFAGMSNDTPEDKLKDVLYKRSRIVKTKDKDCMELKLYNKYGKFIASVKT